MGDTSIAQDLLDGVTDALGDLGDTRTIRIFSEGSLNLSDPGAGRPKTPENIPVEALLYDFEDKYFDGKTVLKGDRNALIDISQLSAAQLSGVKQGSLLIDGSDNWTVVAKNMIEVAGVTVAVILHIRGA
jgi:hypothetical protein